MKQSTRFFIVILFLSYFQPLSTFAQVGIINLGVKGAWALREKKETKQEKLIDKSSKQEKISGTNVTVLRVAESDIKSKAKKHIVALQNRLEQYATQYKNNQPLDIPKNDSDLVAIQTIDEDWPTEFYLGELRAYKRYVFQQKQNPPSVPANTSNAASGDTTKKEIQPTTIPVGTTQIH